MVENEFIIASMEMDVRQRSDNDREEYLFLYESYLVSDWP